MTGVLTQDKSSSTGAYAEAEVRNGHFVWRTGLEAGLDSAL